ncbi:MAG: hypothetical protein WCK11_00700 [Candidatus Falkowbacteria bacterium]
MKNDLLDKLQQIQAAITQNNLGLRKLEHLRNKTRRAFDRAIDSAAKGKNILAEIDLRRKQLRRWRIGWTKTLFPISFSTLLSMPFIYGMLVPAVIFHLCLEIYHRVCFRLYGIPLVVSKDYFVYDRQLLPYLNWLEKVHCFYCSYFNNLLQYGVEIAGRTERYWCPIKYANRIKHVHGQYEKFFDYLDAKQFRSHWTSLRQFSEYKVNQQRKCDITAKKLQHQEIE